MTTATKIRVHVSGDLTKAQALEVVGGLTATSKMPEESFSLSARDCITGAKLHNVPDSVCAKCYALGGMYNFPVVKDAQVSITCVSSSLTQRLKGLGIPQAFKATSRISLSTCRLRVRRCLAFSLYKSMSGV